ncbi:MAG: 2-phospho-L-lactate transferase CofD family protein [Candidatus Bruticola sp.]
MHSSNRKLNENKVPPAWPRTLLLAGGVGGARLAHGFYRLFYSSYLVSDKSSGLLSKPVYTDDRPLHIIINSGDDLTWMGLKVCPDFDTNLYTLAGINHKRHGWGLTNDTWSALQMLKHWPDNPVWFQMGDGDLAVSLQRTCWLNQGYNLAEVSSKLCAGLNLPPCLWPMSLQEVSTYVHTPLGKLPFQEYFVKEKAQVKTLSFSYKGIDKAQPLPGLIELIAQSDLIVLAPSNPFVSLLPILNLPGLMQAIRKSPALKVAVSPLRGGQAFKGPLREMLLGCGLEASTASVLKLYPQLIDKFFVDTQDLCLKDTLQDKNIEIIPTDIDLSNPHQRLKLAAAAVEEARKHVR